MFCLYLTVNYCRLYLYHKMYIGILFFFLENLFIGTEYNEKIIQT